MGAEVFLWLVFGGCLALSFILSGMEAGVFSLSRIRIRQQMRAGRPSARVLHEFIEHPENFLWTILVGNTLANVAALAWLVLVLERLLNDHVVYVMAVYLPLVFLFYALFDLLPKTLFRTFPNRLCMFFARPFRILHRLLRPLVGLVEKVSAFFLRWRGGAAFTGRLFGSREELRMMMQESAQALSSEERRMIERVMDLQKIAVRDSMKPLHQAVVIGSNHPVSDALRLCKEKGHTRFPVTESRDGRTTVIGMLNCDQLLYAPEVDPARPVRDFAQPALYVDEDTRLEVALRRMQRSGHLLAIVLGRDRRETGVIALRDILQVIFGEVSL